MSESLISIAITSAILLAMLVFVPCLELTARGCRRIKRSAWRAGNLKMVRKQSLWALRHSRNAR